jgi:hypothetical protein
MGNDPRASKAAKDSAALCIGGEVEDSVRAFSEITSDRLCSTSPTAPELRSRRQDSTARQYGEVDVLQSAAKPNYEVDREVDGLEISRKWK